jgi:hypothetical protein
MTLGSVELGFSVGKALRTGTKKTATIAFSVATDVRLGVEIRRCDRQSC